jgi:hypothetical protein
MSKVSTLCISAAQWVEDAFELCVRLARPIKVQAVRCNSTQPAQANLEDSAFECIDRGELRLNWPAEITRRVDAGKTVIVDDVPLNEVAELCLRNNYRWRLCNTISTSSAHPRLIVEMAKIVPPPVQTPDK